MLVVQHVLPLQGGWIWALRDGFNGLGTLHATQARGHLGQTEPVCLPPNGGCLGDSFATSGPPMSPISNRSAENFQPQVSCSLPRGKYCAFGATSKGGACLIMHRICLKFRGPSDIWGPSDISRVSGEVLYFRGGKHHSFGRNF